MIDSRPSALTDSYIYDPVDGDLTSDVAGGTFTATDNALLSFTLELGLTGSTEPNSLKAIVMETDGSGKPNGNVIWESPSAFTANGAQQEIEFVPNILLTPSEQYFIGVDSGVYTTDTYGSFTLTYTSEFAPEAIADGEYWDAIDPKLMELIGSTTGPGYSEVWYNPGGDITTRIELGASIAESPEPGVASLLAVGLVAMGLIRRR